MLISVRNRNNLPEGSYMDLYTYITITSIMCIITSTVTISSSIRFLHSNENYPNQPLQPRLFAHLNPDIIRKVFVNWDEYSQYMKK